MTVRLSIVIPLFNEAENVRPLTQEIIAALKPIEGNYEIVLVNDGSTDQTQAELESIREQGPQTIRPFSYAGHRGQGLAIRAGLKAAREDYICLLDGDMQFDPQDILRCYHRLAEGDHDLICGRRRNRKDSTLINVLPSKIGNWLISLVFGTNLTDVGCALKIASRSQMLKIRPFKNYHRYLGLLLVLNGAKYCEVEVAHRSRTRGKTKYSGLKFIGAVKEILGIKLFYPRHLGYIGREQVVGTESEGPTELHES